METEVKGQWREYTIEDHIRLAERHAQMALNKCYTREGPTRGFFFCIALGRAQSILIKLHIKEVKRNKNGN